MPKVVLSKSNKTIEVNESETLMKQLLKNNIPVASSCGGEGICGKCKVQIIEGLQDLTPESILETKTKTTHNIGPNERLSCQLKIKRKIKIDTSYW